MKRFPEVAPAPRRQLVSSAILAVFLSSFAAAQTLTGTVTNGTSGKPAAGDEVILINLGNGMEEAAKTKADSAGKFSFKLADGGGPHLIRAIHQGVTYHQPAPPGTNSVEVQVYDVAKKVAEISVTADVTRVQADNGTLQVTRRFAVHNASVPARTQMNDHNFEFYLPEGAKVGEVMAMAPNGKPINASADPQAEKNRYAIAFPLRPGESQFQVEFTLPYSGTIKMDPKPLYPAQHVVVVLPKTMQFAAANPPQFQSMQDPSQSDSVVQVAQQTQAGQSLGFTLSGTGTISEAPEQTASSSAQSQGRDNRPGGGLGAPIDAPDALQQYSWYILGGFAIVLAGGAWVVMKRKPAAEGLPGAMVSGGQSAASSLAGPFVAPSASSSVPAARGAANSNGLLEALKEEMFQLELDRRQGKIAPAEYRSAKAALDRTLDRALKRQT